MKCTAVLHSAPTFFQTLIALGCISDADIRCTADGFFAVTKSMADILLTMGIESFPNDSNMEQPCSLFFDDWYLYAVPTDSGFVYSLFKMREQEFDAPLGGDGDSPGVTVSFIAANHTMIHACLTSPTFENRKALNREINRIVSVRGQSHHKALKAYFKQAAAQGPYLIAELYTSFIASFAKNGVLDVPVKYAGHRTKGHRIPRFIDANNIAAGYTVCDHRHIYIENPDALNVYEKQAILATHTANTSFHSFAAEIRFHACFLTPPAKLPIPFLGHSAYDSAIRADMSIDDAELQGPTPYYRPNSRMCRLQRKYHPEY